MTDGEKSVLVPAELYAKLSELVEKSGSETVDELAGRIIRDWVSKETAKSAKGEPSQIAVEDEKVVEERLKSLGYM